MRITVLTPRLFDLPTSGGELCTARLLAALHADAHEVRLIGRGRVPGAVSLGPLVAPFDHLPAVHRAASVLGAWAQGEACTVHRLGGGGAAQQAARALLAAPMDALVVDHLQAWAWLRPVWRQLPAPLLVLHNLEARGYAEQAAASQGWPRRVLLREARQLARLEAEALRHAAAVACLSADDLQALPAGATTPQAVRLVLPGHPPTQDWLSSQGVGRHRSGRGRHIGLLGTWTWAPNRDALQWMLAEVLPRLDPGCRLLLADTGLDRLPVQLPPALHARVRVLGRVDAAADFYRQVDVVALPSLRGSGVQEKAIEAIGQAPVVVATSHALRGLGPGLPGQVLVADEAAAFAALCSQALPSTPAQRLATQNWARQRAGRYRQQLALGLQASAASRPLFPPDRRPAVGTASGGWLPGAPAR